jgi:hypothetical protein
MDEKFPISQLDIAVLDVVDRFDGVMQVWKQRCDELEGAGRTLRESPSYFRRPSRRMEKLQEDYLAQEGCHEMTCHGKLGARGNSSASSLSGRGFVNDD